MAHAIMVAEATRRGLRINVLSAGVWDFEGTPAAQEALLTCKRNNTTLQKFIATPVHSADLSDVTRVFVMERDHISALLAETSLSSNRISLLSEYDPQQRGEDISDPIGQDSAAFEACYQRMRDCIVHYLETTDDFKPGTSGTAAVS
jgi:protein-tyrosine-phosphatase